MQSGSAPQRPLPYQTGSGAIELAMDFDGLGIKGARTSLELQAGPCTVRFAYRTEAGAQESVCGPPTARNSGVPCR